MPLAQSTVNNALALTGSFYPFAASSYFPWAAIERALPALRPSFQQPRRLDPIAIALLCASMALLPQLIGKPYCDYLPNLHRKKPLAVREDYRQEVMLRNPLFAKRAA